MKIPKQFELMGHVIRVRMVDDLAYTQDNTGTARYRDSELLLQKDNSGHRRKSFQIEHDFCHELVHFILGRIGEEELNENEQFVDLFGGLLYQAMKSAKY